MMYVATAESVASVVFSSELKTALQEVWIYTKHQTHSIAEYFQTAEEHPQPESM